MASLLRQIVASPRIHHHEAGLDLCYVTDRIVVTSGPSSTYPRVAYRNPLKDLVRFLDTKHGVDWCIWEFRAEGTGYDDADVYGRVRHFPWPDHHPPPFALVPLIMKDMRAWLEEKEERVAVVHCKAGKGRSGTVACSYLISQEQWSPEEAMRRFTERRMRPGFGAGISIPSQRRTVGYVARWAKHGQVYVDSPVEVLELHIWGLRKGVKIAVEGFVEEGKVIKNFHTFQKSEREVVRGTRGKSGNIAGVQERTDGMRNGVVRMGSDLFGESGGDVVFRPAPRVVIPSSDVNIDFERRNKSKYAGFTVVTAVAHVWFNAFFEGNGPEKGGKADEAGVFSIEWAALDGIKGSERKGTRAFDRVAVVWRRLDSMPQMPSQPSASGVPELRPANPQQNDELSQDMEKKLGLREATSASAPISRASSATSQSETGKEDVQDELEGVQTYLQNNG